MSRKQKLEKKLLRKPSDFSWDDAIRLFSMHGYDEIKKGKTSGSRSAFYNKEKNHIIRLHRPHPANNLKMYQMNEVIKQLEL